MNPLLDFPVPENSPILKLVPARIWDEDRDVRRDSADIKLSEMASIKGKYEHLDQIEASLDYRSARALEFFCFQRMLDAGVEAPLSQAKKLPDTYCQSTTLSRLDGDLFERSTVYDEGFIDDAGSQRKFIPEDLILGTEGKIGEFICLHRRRAEILRNSRGVFLNVSSSWRLELNDNVYVTQISRDE